MSAAAPTRNDTTIEASPDVPTITITREFEHPRAKVFRAFADPDLYAQWVGPHGLPTSVDEWEFRTGGHYVFTQRSEGFVGRFFGSFHEVRQDERIVQTFTWDGAPDGVSLETLTFEELPGNRCRIVGLSVVDSMELRDIILSSGMETGVIDGYEKLDALLAD